MGASRAWCSNSGHNFRELWSSFILTKNHTEIDNGSILQRSVRVCVYECKCHLTGTKPHTEIVDVGIRQESVKIISLLESKLCRDRRCLAFFTRECVPTKQIRLVTPNLAWLFTSCQLLHSRGSVKVCGDEGAGMSTFELVFFWDFSIEILINININIYLL